MFVFSEVLTAFVLKLGAFCDVQKFFNNVSYSPGPNLWMTLMVAVL